MPNPKKPRTECLWCKNEPKRAGYKYCSNICQHKYQQHMFILRWKRGEVVGLQKLGIVSVYIKNYLREKYHNKCSMCGWSKINKKTGKVPLVADHIDGHWQNNSEKNLRLICPNCDSLSETYAGLNKGNGRKHRTVSMRVRKAHELLS